MHYIPHSIRRRFLPDSIPLMAPSNQNAKPEASYPVIVKPTDFLPGGKVMLAEYTIDKAIGFNVHDKETGSFIYTATFNIQNANFKTNDKYVYLRGWGIYTGVPEAFENTGLVKLTGLYHQFENGERAPLALLSPRLKGHRFNKDGK